MTRVFSVSLKEEPLQIARTENWIRALNTLVSNTQISANELAEATDIQLVEDGKVQCPRDGQARFGNSSGSRVFGAWTYAKADGTRQLIRMGATKLQKYNTVTSNFDDITGYTYTSSLNADAVTAYDKLYVCNGTDPLTRYDGSSITSFTEISAPSAPTVTRTGSSGSYTFSYKITAVTAVGETTPSSAGSTTLNQATLDTTSYMTVSWSAVTNAIGYNVYGRKDGNWKFMIYLEGNSSTSFVDKGVYTPQEAFGVPEGNTTGGPKGKYIDLYKDSLFIFGDPNNPSRLYYSGGGDKIDDFTIGGGGGFVDISKNDGQIGTGLQVFKNSLLAFKEDSIYQFSFTTSGLPEVVQVTPAVGCVAPRTIIAVENDVWFLSRRGMFSVGNVEGFVSDILRTNELSSKVRSIIRTIDAAYIGNATAHYVTDANKNLILLSYTPSGSTTNSKALVFDRERLGWVKWTNITANCWVTWRGTDGVVHYLYGDDSSGYMNEIITGTTDFGSAIRGYFRVKAEAFNELDRYKILKDISIVLRRPSGRLRLNIIKDGVDTVYSTNIGTVSPTINWGHYVFSRFLFKTAYGTGVSSQDENVLRTLKNLNLEGRSFMLEFDNNSSASFTLLLTTLTARFRSLRYRKSEEIVST